jgi:hypothetical protein
MNHPGIEAARKLALMGYRFKVEGDTMRYEWQGPGQPDPAQVKPLLEAVKAHKPEVIHFLKYCCPKCGGVVFVGEECFLCDWLPRARQEVTQGPVHQGQALTCGECAHFLPSRLNPSQGFGCCGLPHLSKRPGAYPGKTACPRFEAPAGDGSLRLPQ